MRLIPPLLPAHLPINMAVILRLSSSNIPILNQTKEVEGSIKQRPTGAHGLAIHPLMVGGPTIM